MIVNRRIAPAATDPHGIILRVHNVAGRRPNSAKYPIFNHAAYDGSGASAEAGVPFG